MVAGVSSGGNSCLVSPFRVVNFANRIPAALVLGAMNIKFLLNC